MSIKAKAPKVDPETQARQKQAEQRAEASRIEATQQGVSEETRAVIRQFGRLAAFSGAPSLASVGVFQGAPSLASGGFIGATASRGGRLSLASAR